MTPFQRASVPQDQIESNCAAFLAEWQADKVAFCKLWGFPPEATAEEITKPIRDVANDEIYVNNKYQVNLRNVEPMPGSGFPPMVHVSIKRLDKAPFNDWREMQQIKNDLVGKECEGCQLYPADSRVVDTANQMHLWVFRSPEVRFPFGFPHGVKSDAAFGRSKQRAFSNT